MFIFTFVCQSIIPPECVHLFVEVYLATNLKKLISAISNRIDYRCDLEVTSLPHTQWGRVRFPVGSISWLRFFRSFSQTVRQMSEYLGHIRPRVLFGHHNNSKPYSSVFGRRRSLTLDILHGRI